MNAEKAKNAVLVFFIAINAILFALLYSKQNSFRLSSDQEKAITNLLAQNKIALYTPVLADFSPLRQLSMTGQDDFSKLQAVLFGGGEPDRIVDEFYRTVKYYQNGTAEISREQGQNSLKYDNPDGFAFENLEGEVTANSAKELCDKFLDAVREKNIDYSFERSTDGGDGSFVLEYRGKYKGYTIYTNYARFLINNQGIIQLIYSFITPTGFAGPQREIYSADEALLILLFRLKDLYDGEPLRITQMDIVYYLEEGSNEDSVAFPCYRFFVMPANLYGQTEQILINAYTNEIVIITKIHS